MPLLTIITNLGMGGSESTALAPTLTRMRGENRIVMPAQNRSMFMAHANRSIIMPSRRKKVKL